MIENINKIKENYINFRTKLWPLIEKKNFNDSYKMVFSFEAFLMEISLSEINDKLKNLIIQFNLLVNDLKATCSYKNQRELFLKFESLDNFYFKNIKDFPE